MATSLTAVPKLYIWPKRSLYLGTRYVPLREYTVGSDQLVVCLEGEVLFDLPNGKQRACRSMLLKAGTTVQMDALDTTQAIIAVCYLNPVGQDYLALKKRMGDRIEETDVDHADEVTLIRQLRKIRDSRLSSRQAAEVLTDLIFPPEMERQRFREYDPRIIAVVQRINETVRDNVSVGTLAEEVHLSESRLVKLFKQQLGVPITKYRLRYRVFIGVIHLALGHSVTDAALAAGFSSTAHFSKCFSAMIGTQPSTTFLTRPFLDVVIDDECLCIMRVGLEA